MHRSTRPFSLVHWPILLWVALALVIVGCSPTAANIAPTATPVPQPQTFLTVSGTTSTLAILTALQPGFVAAQPDYQFNVQTRSGAGASSGPTVEGVAKGSLDVAAINRALKDEEIALGVEATQFGRGAVAIFTHPDVGVASLTGEQVKGIFAGTITNWADVGGPNLPIVVYVRNEDNSVTEMMRKTLFGDTPFGPKSQVVDKSNELQVTIEGTPGGIGYGGWPSMLVSKTTARPIALEDVGPADAAYPITQPLLVCYRNDDKERVQPLVDWLLSEEGQVDLQNIGVITSW